MIEINLGFINSEILTNKKYRPEGYDKWVEIRSEMRVHTHGENPGKILNSIRPNETDEILKYRIDSYYPITSDPIQKAIDKSSNIIQDSSYSISVTDGLTNYLNDQNFQGKNFYTFINKYHFARSIDDPNGYLIVLPSKKNYEDTTERALPILKIIDSNFIKYVDENFFTWEEPLEYVVLSGGVVGMVYYTLTKEALFRHVETDLNKELKFVVTQIYDHKIGMLPIVLNGGNEFNENCLRSFFDSYIPFANLTIGFFSDWAAVNRQACHPTPIVNATICKANGCVNGKVKNYYDEENPEKFQYNKCVECNDGLIVHKTPFGVYYNVLNENNSYELSKSSLSSPALQYVSPDPAIIREAREGWMLMFEKAEKALNIITSTIAQSGVAKVEDKEDRYSQLIKISNYRFDEIYFNVLFFFEKILNPSYNGIPRITKPISFEIKTEAKLIENIKNISESNLPSAFKNNVVIDLAAKMFSNDPYSYKIIEVQVAYDTIYNLTGIEKSALQATGNLKKETIIKSEFCYKVLKEIANEQKENFLLMSINEVFLAIDLKMEQVILDNLQDTSINLLV